MKTVLGLFTGVFTLVSLICTALWFWIGVVAGLFMGAAAFTAGAGLLVVLFHTFGYGLLFGIGTLVLGIIVTGISALMTNKLLG